LGIEKQTICYGEYRQNSAVKTEKNDKYGITGKLCPIGTVYPVPLPKNPKTNWRNWLGFADYNGYTAQGG